MSAVSWEEVKRLAADFQRAQLTTTSQTLSERNFVEIVSKLIENHDLEVIFTNDGKQYITPEYLLKEIQDELYVHGGRINLVELAKILNVNVNYVMAKISSLEELLPGCIVIMGQLISRDYQKTIAQEINDRLQSTGQVTVGELTKLYDLPGDFLQDVIDENLGNVINAKQDKLDARILYTEQFVNKNKSVLRGTLRALTKPTQVSIILSLTNFKTERDFYRTFDYLSEDKDLCGVLTGRQGNSSFIPHVHTKHQNDWVDNFYKQNGYLEYDALTRLGISDPVLFVRRHFPGMGFLELPTCIIGPQLLGQVDAAVNDTLLSGTFLDVMMLVPSVMGPSDVSKILEEILKKNKSKAVAHIFSDTVIVTETFLQTVCQPLQEEVLKEKAEKAVSSGAYIMAHTEYRINTSSNFTVDTKTEKREERRKKATGGKSGGGTQGRETKMKSTKKKYVKGRGEPVEDSGSDTEPVKKPGAPKLDLITVKEIEEWLMENQQMQDLVDIEGIVKEISKHLQPQLNKKAMELASEAYERTLVSSVSQRKQLHGDLQERIDSWQMEMKLSERGLKLFPFEDTRIKLSTHLLKTTGTEVANALCLYVSEDPTLPTTSKELTQQMRKKIISELPGDTKVVLTTLNNSLSSGSVEEFFNALEPALMAVGLLNRKIDKKKEKQFLQSKREKLLTEVSTTDNPANLLHSGLLLVFQMQTQSLLSASGKFVPAILNFLQPQLPAEFFTRLHQFQELVLKLLTVGDDQEAETKLKGELNELMLALKESIVTYKKTTPATDQNG
ncbi:E3 UFM1-protein ligase 1 homolog [Cimex lectularius]|uniref:E3 UFM1-protein ligase 1 homolog n=1 Tax=Cimex lectularius TaxID=79782 RepID=A0A8I6TIH4_CIMLE|nr:E3 UFM1-protein ligase 1 homolog [Cimex lectularius]